LTPPSPERESATPLRSTTVTQRNVLPAAPQMGATNSLCGGSGGTGTARTAQLGATNSGNRGSGGPGTAQVGATNSGNRGSGGPGTAQVGATNGGNRGS